MKRRMRYLLPLICLFLGCIAWADQVNLKNGDRVTGKIQKKEGASLIVQSDLLGLVTIPWDAVTQVTSDEPLTVVLPDGKSVQGKITVDNQKLAVATPAASESVDMAQVDAIRNAEEQKAWERLQRPGMLSLWTGFAGLGLGLARGNAETTTVTTAVNATRETRNDKTTAYFNQLYSKGKLVDGTSATTAKAVRGGWAYNRNLTSRLFANLFNDYEYDAFQNLDLRFVLGGGLGYAVIKRESTTVDLLGGIDYNREKFSTPLTRNSAEAYWGNNLTHKFSKFTTLTQSFRMFNNLNNTGEYRMNFDLGTSTVLRKWLSWQVALSDRYLSNPVLGHEKNDLLLTTGLRVTFAR